MLSIVLAATLPIRELGGPLLGRTAAAETLLPENAFQVKVEAIDARRVVATLRHEFEHYVDKTTVRIALKDVKGRSPGQRRSVVNIAA